MIEELETVKEENKVTVDEVENIELMSWDTWRDIGYSIKLFFGFTFLGWFKPKGYDYGYFQDPITVVCKSRGDDRVVHTRIQVFSINEGIDIFK